MNQLQDERDSYFLYRAQFSSLKTNIFINEAHKHVITIATCVDNVRAVKVHICRRRRVNDCTINEPMINGWPADKLSTAAVDLIKDNRLSDAVTQHNCMLIAQAETACLAPKSVFVARRAKQIESHDRPCKLVYDRFGAKKWKTSHI